MSVVLLSGGIDSTTALFLEHQCCPPKTVECLSFNYGQRHVKELSHAERIAYYLGVKWTCLDMPPLDCPLTGSGNIPLGIHFNDPLQSATVVPNRNMVMLSIAGAYAASHGHARIVIGCHGGDAEIYADCRESFIDAMCSAMRISCGVVITAPFIRYSKVDVVRLAMRLGVDLNSTWTCYLGGDEPCGECGACIERMEAIRDCVSG